MPGEPNWRLHELDFLELDRKLAADYEEMPLMKDDL